MRRWPPSLSARHDLRLRVGQGGIDRRDHVASKLGKRRYRGLAGIVVRGGENDRRSVVASIGEFLPRQHRFGNVRIDDIVTADAEPVPDQQPLLRRAQPRFAHVERSRPQRMSRARHALGPGTLDVRETRLRSPQQRLLIWDWFRIGSHDVVDPYIAKAMLAWEKLANRGDDGTAIILAPPYDDPSQPPVATL